MKKASVLDLNIDNIEKELSPNIILLGIEPNHKNEQ